MKKEAPKVKTREGQKKLVMIYIPIIGWIIAHLEWRQACRIYEHTGRVPFTTEWDNTFKTYDKTVVAFGSTAVFLMLCLGTFRLISVLLK